MNLLRLVLYVLGGAVVVGTAVMVFASLDARCMGKRLALVLQRMESSYLEFVRSKISLDVLAAADHEISVEPLLADALRLLEPDLEALVAGINSSSMTSVHIPYTSPLLSNLTLMAESLNKTRSGPNKQLSAAQGEQLQDSLEKALRSDLLRRKMNLEAGKL